MSPPGRPKGDYRSAKHEGTPVRRRLITGAAVLCLIAALAIVWVLFMNLRDESPRSATAARVASAEQVSRGAYLALAGNCMGCHTAQGGAPYAGGRGVPTPFGTVIAPNLTPDDKTGIGAWSPDDFWRALHNGRSRDGRLLYPAFPYPNYTRIQRDDADAIFAWLRHVPAVEQANRPHELQFPFNLQAALAVWRALYFRPGAHQADSQRSPEANRGAYLVEGLGHCNACHSRRNALGASTSPLDLAGGLIPVQNWYAPSLTSAQEAGVAAWEMQDIVDLLKTGVSPRGSVAGPMGDVVLGSTQHLSEPDLRAIAVHLKALPQTPPMETEAAPHAAAGPGAKLYERHCAGCHGDAGEGAAGAYPALAGNRAVTLPTVANLVHVVLEGGFPPATEGNPRPYGMPPFATVLSVEETAQLLSFVRGSWGNGAAAVSALEVERFRGTK
ncbi:MAG: cytochrome c [Burkholderiaceae bacterium]